MANTDGARLEKRRIVGDNARQEQPTAGGGGEVADADGIGRGEGRPESTLLERRHGVDGRGASRDHHGAVKSGVGMFADGLSGGLGGCMNAWSGDWEQGVSRVASNVPHRPDKVRALGNSVVPQVAAYAFQALMRALGETR